MVVPYTWTFNMALFLGTWNVPTNQRLRVNNTMVERVFCGGVLVWQYRNPIGPGGLPTAGSRGYWVNTGRRIILTYHRGSLGVTSTIRGSLGYGEKQGALVNSTPDSGALGTSWGTEYAIMRWIPA